MAVSRGYEGIISQELGRPFDPVGNVARVKHLWSPFFAQGWHCCRAAPLNPGRVGRARICQWFCLSAAATALPPSIVLYRDFGNHARTCGGDRRTESERAFLSLSIALSLSSHQMRDVTRCVEGEPPRNAHRPPGGRLPACDLLSPDIVWSSSESRQWASSIKAFNGRLPEGKFIAFIVLLATLLHPVHHFQGRLFAQL